MPFQKGKAPWNKGKKLPYTVWNKNLKGVIKQTPEMVAKRVEKIKGKKRSEETKKKISESQKGEKGYWFGHKHSDEMKLRISNKLKGRPSWNRGLKFPERSGEKHWNWKGGIWKDKLRDKVSGHYMYRQLKCDVLQRDNYRCQDCGISGNLDLHHIKPFSIIVSENNVITLDDAVACDELWNMNNCISLCRDCHKKTDSYGGKMLKK